MNIKRLSELNDAQMRNLLRSDVEEVTSVVKRILEDVLKNGDSAVIKYTKKFDDAVLKNLEVIEEDIKDAEASIDAKLIKHLEKAARNIAAFHDEQLNDELWLTEFRPGIMLGQKTTPLDRIGAYVPGGTASYPSTALMTVIPAKVAGVREVCICTPPRPDGTVNPLTLAAAGIAGANRIFKVGGAQAIAAMAYGTKSIPKVDKIVGPGNVYVTAAKMLVRNDVEIDFPAGPSEIVILTDQVSEAKIASFIASDMIAQAEHDASSVAILITTSKKLAEKVDGEIERQVKKSLRKDVITRSLKRSAILVADDLEQGIDFVNTIAPEHLELMVPDPLNVLKNIKHAGAIFIGEYSPVAAGDYAVGTNHVLPTMRYARVLSGLDVAHFAKKSSIHIISKSGLRDLKDTIIALAEAEGLEAHANSVRKRFER
ncbi:MAG: histidinol dehydrogenase [Methanosarcinales archaeon Met12]|nr:MAG: histidinol dehydrogenase [Methanosarcinales archaeon Met12]